MKPKRIISICILVFLTSAVYSQAMEKSYNDILVIYPEEIRIELKFVKSDSIGLQEELPIKLLTEKELKIELKKHTNITLTELGSIKFEDLGVIEVVKYELTIGNYETYKDIRNGILRTTMYETKGFEKINLENIESQFIEKMDSEIKHSFCEEYHLKNSAVKELELSEATKTKFININESSNGFSLLKEKFIKDSVGKYYIQEDGSFAWKRKMIVSWNPKRNKR